MVKRAEDKTRAKSPAKSPKSTSTPKLEKATDKKANGSPTTMEDDEVLEIEVTLTHLIIWNA